MNIQYFFLNIFQNKKRYLANPIETQSNFAFPEIFSNIIQQVRIVFGIMG